MLKLLTQRRVQVLKKNKMQCFLVATYVSILVKAIVVVAIYKILAFTAAVK